MSKNPNQKLKLLYLYQILLQRTDENHKLTTDELRAALERCGICLLYTSNALDYNPSRTVRENKIADIKAREKLVNSIPSPVFLSIHLNKFSDAQYHGAQVFYSTGNVQGKPLAEQIQQLSLIHI